MPTEVLLGKPPRLLRDVTRITRREPELDLTGLDLDHIARDVLRHPTVASKRFLVTIGDRTVGGLTHRDQMVGPWQVPVSDVAVTLADFDGFAGEAMSSGERFPLAGVDAPASGRMAVGEALTNLLAAPVSLDRVKLSCNWMAACGEPGEDAALYDTVRAVGLQLCPQLGIGVPVGKDSLSMRTRWIEDGSEHEVISPVSLLVSAFAHLPDARGTLTPQLRGGGALVLVDLGAGADRMGGSILAQVLGQFGGRVPDLDDPGALRALYAAVGELRDRGLLTAYHDRSDGGVWATVCEMGFAGRQGVRLDLASLVGARRPGGGGAGPAHRGARCGRRGAPRARGPRPGHPRLTRARRGQPRGRHHRWRPEHRGGPRLRGRRARVAARAAAGLGRGELADRGPARQPRLRRRGARGRRRRGRPGAAPGSSPSTRTTMSPGGSSRRRAPRSRCCASRASTATSRPATPSTSPASTPTTCT